MIVERLKLMGRNHYGSVPCPPIQEKRAGRDSTDRTNHGNSSLLTWPEIPWQRPTAWLGISDSNFDVQRENSSL
jgi:hypothetical protein